MNDETRGGSGTREAAPEELSCEESLALVYEYLDGELPADWSDAVRDTRSDPLEAERNARGGALIIGASDTGIAVEVQVVGEQADDAPAERLVANAQWLERSDELASGEPSREQPFLQGLPILADIRDQEPVDRDRETARAREEDENGPGIDGKHHAAVADVGVALPNLRAVDVLRDQARWVDEVVVLAIPGRIGSVFSRARKHQARPVGAAPLQARYIVE